MEDLMEGRKLNDQYLDAASLESKAAAMLAIKDFMFRLSLAAAAQ